MKKIKAADTNQSHYPYVRTLLVDGMTCANCRKKIENAFNILTGIYAVADLEKKLVVIRMKEKIEDEELKDIVRNAGYFPGKFL